eukprot:PRCOL_00006986-RA
MMPALTTGVAAKGHRVRKGALVRREAFAERVLAAAEGAANATGKAVPKEKPAQLGKSRSARRRAKRAAGAARAFNFGDVDLEEVLRAQGAGVNTKGKRGASGLLADDATKNKTRERVTVSESARLEQVVSHGAFTADPLGAVRRHLEALLPDEPKSSKASKGGKGSANRNGSARAKEKRARARQGLPVGGDAMRG